MNLTIFCPGTLSLAAVEKNEVVLRERPTQGAGVALCLSRTMFNREANPQRGSRDSAANQRTAQGQFFYPVKYHNGPQ